MNVQYTRYVQQDASFPKHDMKAYMDMQSRNDNASLSVS